HAFELIHPAGAARSRELGVGEVAAFENRYQHKDGSWHSLLWTATFTNDRWYGVAKDVTAPPARRDGRRLRDDRLYRAIVEQTAQGIWALDENDRTIFVNRQLAVLLGYSQEEMLGRR